MIEEERKELVERLRNNVGHYETLRNQAADEIERLSAVLAVAQASEQDAWARSELNEKAASEYAGKLIETEATLASAAAKVGELREVLEPFARHADGYHSFDGQHDFLDSDEIKLGAFKCTVGDLRRARAALASTAPIEEQK